MHLRTYIAACLLAGAVVANAHAPYDSSTVARLEGDSLELTVTTSAEIARHLIEAPMNDLTPLNDLQPQLVEIGAKLFAVTSSGQALKPERVFFTERAGEAIFSLIYPLPTRDELQFQALYLDKLPLGYGGSIEVINEKGNVLGRQPLLTRGEANNTFSLRIDQPIASPTKAIESVSNSESVVQETPSTPRPEPALQARETLNNGGWARAVE